MDNLRIGMVGTGFIADWHLKGFEAVPDAKITGMCRDLHGTPENQRQQLRALKKKCKELGPRAYDSFDEMVKDDEIDALIIGSINPYHFEQIRVASIHKKHVLVEKPVVTDPGRVDELIQWRDENKFKIFPAHNFVYRDSVRKAREIITSGKLGQIIHSSFIVTHTIGEGHAKGWRAIKELARGGTLIDSGHHLIYQTLYLLGRPVKLHGFTSRMVLHDMECEDTAQVSLRYRDGSMAVVMQSWTADPKDEINGIRIFGTKGSLMITDALYHNGEKVNDDVDYENSFRNQAKAFRDYVFNDIQPLSGLEDVRDTLKVTYGAYKSNDENAVISF